MTKQQPEMESSKGIPNSQTLTSSGQANAGEPPPNGVNSQSGSYSAIENTVEAPVTQPFEGYTYIKKEWIDQEDGVEKVTLNVTMGHLKLPADWSHTEAFVMMPEWGSAPLKRSWIIRIPTHFEEKDRYLLHYYFQSYYSNGLEKVSHTFTHLITPQEFEYIDYSGTCVFVRLHWSVGNWSYCQDTEFEIDGIPWGSEFSVSQAPYRGNDRLFRNGRALIMQPIPLPRRFRCFVWVPKGATIHYCFQLIKVCPEGFHTHWENNFGKNFSLTI